MPQEKPKGFDVAGARKAGYSDSEIRSHLSKYYDVDGAVKAGYSLDEIGSAVSFDEPKPQPQDRPTGSTFWPQVFRQFQRNPIIQTLTQPGRTAEQAVGQIGEGKFLAGGANLANAVIGGVATPFTVADATLREIGLTPVAEGAALPFKAVAGIADLAGYAIDPYVRGYQKVLPFGEGVAENPEAAQAFGSLNQALAQMVLMGGAGKAMPKQTGGMLKPNAPSFIERDVAPKQDVAKVPEVDTRGTLPPAEIKSPGKMMERWTKMREVVENDWVRVKQLLHETDAKITSDKDPYLRKELMPGRIGEQQGALQEAVGKIDIDVVKTSKRLGLPDAQLTNKVNEYLRAVHAPERNAVLGEGAAGITTKNARLLRKQIESSPNGVEIQRIANQVRILNTKGLDILRDSGLISGELHTKLRKDYPNHVPLNRIMDEVDLNEFFSSEGFDVKGSGLRRARGSDRPVSDILGNVAENLAKIQVRAEKNIVDLAVLEFARQNPQLGVFEVVPRKAIGKTFSGQPIMKQVNDPSVLHLMEDGKPVMLRIKDPQLAAAIRGVNVEYLPPLMRGIGTFTRFFSGLATRFNPDFFLPNKIRDLQELAPTLAAQEGVGFKGAAKTIFRDPASVKDVFDALRGKDTPGARLYKQLRQDGGTTGGMALSTKQQVQVSIEKIRQLNRSRPRQAAQTVIRTIDDINTIFEDSSRLSVYKTALDKGMSRDRAAFLAKNSTINFNRRGTGTPIINALWMFSNASVQGSAKMLRALRDPKVAGAVVGGMGASLAAIHTYNDSVDPEWRSSVSKGDRLNNLIVMLPSEEGASYIKIPISWGLKSIKVIEEAALDAAVGKGRSGDEVASEISSAILEAYNPLGGSDVVSALTPTIADVPMDVARNKRWSGGMIRPHDYGNKPPSQLTFKGFGKTTIERTAQGVTSAMSDLGIEVSPADLAYAIEQYIGGTGRFIGKTITTIFSIGRNVPDSRDVPFSGRFYGSRTSEEIQAQRDRDTRKRGPTPYRLPSVP